jgi:hypothetical protein
MSQIHRLKPVGPMQEFCKFQTCKHVIMPGDREQDGFIGYCKRHHSFGKMLESVKQLSNKNLD